MNYDEAVKHVWRHADVSLQGDAARLKALIRYATLAPSGHNTQCWRFRVGERAIGIIPDLSRRTPVVDPDDHHLYVSLGCAAENLSLAARAFGLSGEVDFRPEGDGEVVITLIRARQRDRRYLRPSSRASARAATTTLGHLPAKSWACSRRREAGAA